MSFESCRSLGRVSTLLILLGPALIPVALVVSMVFRFSQLGIILSILVSVLAFAGQIMFLVAMSRFSDYYQEPKIFRNVLYSFITGIVGGIGLVMVLFFVMFTFLTSVIAIPSASLLVTGGVSTPSFFYFFILLFVVMMVGTFVLALVQGIFYRRAFNALAEKSGQDNFKTAGFLMFLGGILTIVLVGGIVFFVGWIFAAKGFFSMRAPAPQTYSPSQQIPAAVPVQQRYCPNCGAANPVDTVFCSHCGKKL